MSAPESGLPRVLFAPDWRRGVGYQQFLGESLAPLGFEVVYPPAPKGALPFVRSLRQLRPRPDLIHLHWPEAYFEKRNDELDGLRRIGFPLDLRLARRGVPLVLTAHNLYPHDRRGLAFIEAVCRDAYRQADRVIAHSAAAAELIAATFGIPSAKIAVIPHGDLSAEWAPLPSRAEARKRLGLGLDTPFCLMFGDIVPYKGIDEILDFWERYRPGIRLCIAGGSSCASYGELLRKRAAQIPDCQFHNQWLPEEELRDWLAASNCVLFNYRHILTSGATSLTRSLGIPLLMPARHLTVDLAEPHPGVFRFSDLDETFLPILHQAMGRSADPEGAAAWREQIGWADIARKTAAVYRQLLPPTFNREKG